MELETIDLTGVDELIQTAMDSFRITWTDRFNTERDIRKLSKAHLAALPGFLAERSLRKCKKIILAEIKRRATGSYPEDFDVLVEEYKARPEIWRLKIYD